ncbi:hypothetical protein V1512DRAFT_279229 [Lipomyces arxii]|uniref:uncharacterized protein n=1 Tax=Lipomyces arxii TaxID=56418 RepID=UPI0034CDFA64
MSSGFPSSSSPSSSSPNSPVGTPALSTDMTSPRSPSQESSTSLTNKRPFSGSYEDEGSPRIRLLEDDTRQIPLRLSNGEKEDYEGDRSMLDEWLSMPIQTTEVPSRADQITQVEKSNITMSENDTWYVLSQNWYSKFLNQDLPTEDIGVIDNSDLLNEKGNLKPAHQCNLTLVSQDAWKLLTAWYDPEGETEGIARTAVNTSTMSKNIEVEIYPPTFRLHHLTQTQLSSKTVPSIIMSRTSHYSDLKTAIRERLDISNPNAEIRIWRLLINLETKLDLEWFKQTTDKELLGAENEQTTLDDLGLGVDTDLVVEGKSMLSGRWFSDLKGGIGSHMSSFPANSTPTATTSFTAARKSARPPSHMVTRRQQHQHQQQQASRTKGTTGLSNLGNTCYMNSALQCLTHIEELTRYFLLDGYKSELNPHNPLGMDGKVANAYASLIHTIFGDKNSTPTSYSPRDFKTVISRYGPMFSGYGQHDSQEFLAFLLDGLHEDLNRILKKPYTEKPELADDLVGSKEAVVELANKFWDLHLMRNDSIVQDLFAGMYKSTLVCPECKKVSITFDPYMDLTLPLPIDNTWSREIIFVPAKGRPVKVAVELNGGASVKEYKHFVAKIVNADPDKMISASIFNNKFFSFHFDAELIADKIDSSEEGLLYELDDVPDAGYSEVSVFPVLNKLEPDPASKFSSADIFGYPFLISLTKTEATSYDIIYAKLVEKYKGMSTNTVLARWGLDPELIDMGVGSGDRPEVFTVGAVSGYRRLHPSLNAMMSGLDRPTNIVDRYDEVMAKRHKKTPLATPIAVESEQATSFDGRSTVEQGDSDDAVASGSEDKMEDAELDVVSPLAIPSPSADGVEDIDADEHWLDASRRNSSDLDMQDVSDKEYEPSKDNDDSDSSGGIPSMSALFDDARSDNAVSYVPARPVADDGAYEFSGSETSILQSYVFMGETLICEWTRQTYDLCFGATDDEDQERGRPVWEIIETVVSEDVKYKRAQRQAKKNQDITLEDCLNLFSKSEVLGEDDLWYCPRCKKHRQAVKTFEIWSVPDIFTIHLKRFSSTSRRDKIDVKIDFPVEGLDLSGRIGDSQQAQDPQNLLYDLIAVDNHFGGIGGGHYTADVKNFVDGKWYNYDDSSVRQIEPKQAVTSAAYMLFYRRRSVQTLGGPKLRKILEGGNVRTVAGVGEPLNDNNSMMISDKDSVASSSSSSLSPPPYSDLSLATSELSDAPSPTAVNVPIGPRLQGERRTLGPTSVLPLLSGQSITAWPVSASSAPVMKYGSAAAINAENLDGGNDSAALEEADMSISDPPPTLDGDVDDGGDSVASFEPAVDDGYESDDVVEIKPPEYDDSEESVDNIVVDGS